MRRRPCIAGLVGFLALLPACRERPAEPDPAALPAVALAPPFVLDLSGSQWALWLDAKAAWEEDDLHLPGVELEQLPVHKPTGGWTALESGETLAVSVPGTVEQFLWGALAEMRADEAAPADVPNLDGDFTGVSWWCRSFEVPAAWLAPVAMGPRSSDIGAPVVELEFDAVRLRAEVFLNEQFIGYDAVGNTPFRVDATRAVRPGRNTLAVRVTDPGGNFSWEDFDAHRWGSHTIPASHGFGGLTGPVRLSVRAPVHLSDVSVWNTQPGTDPSQVFVNFTVRNTTRNEVKAIVRWELLSASGEPVPGIEAREHDAHAYPPGEDYENSLNLEAPGIALWSPESPNLYRVRVSLLPASLSPVAPMVGDDATAPDPEPDPPLDVVERRFGFRTFSVEGVGEDAVFRLNGERIVLRSAISWGFWPASGLVPTPELARRQVEAAKSLGLNMLNHHRTIAAPGLLDLHDELGLLAYCEPGGYAVHGGDELCQALAREKWLRMIRRDRSHPSVVIWNLINEETAEPTEAQRRDLRDGYALDRSRAMTFTSGWVEDGDDPRKLHAPPWRSGKDDFDPFLTTGWSDDHNAPGPGVWRDEFWKSPADYLRRSENRAEIVFWGEEGAIAAPPRLAKIAARVDATEPGWDGADYLAWHAATKQWLEEQSWVAAGGDVGVAVDAFTTGLGSVAYDYQARAIENVRLGDVADGYVINGWEDSKLENHSGIVDVWRHLKSDPAPLARANAPLSVVVRLRQSVVHASEWLSPTMQSPTGVVADIGLINEAGLSGPHTLVLTLRDGGGDGEGDGAGDGAGREVWRRASEAQVSGGDVYGQMLAEAVAVTVEAEAGRYLLAAELHAGSESGPVVASGSDELLLVDWKSHALPANIALFEKGHALRRFFDENLKGERPIFQTDLPPLDVIAVGDWDPEPRDPIPAEMLELVGRFYKGDTLPPAELASGGAPQATREGGPIDFEWLRDEPEPGVGAGPWVARWTGTLTAPQTGPYLFHTLSDDGVRVWLDGELLIDNWESHSPEYDRAGPVELEAGSTHALRVEYMQKDVGATLRLLWTLPERIARVTEVTDDLVRRAQVDGTTVLLLARAEVWARLLAERGLVGFDGALEHGRYWLGGGFVAREHRVFSGLPTGPMGRPWQELVQYNARRSGLYLSGEEALVACVSDHHFRPATALGVVTVGQGRIVLSTLDLLRTLNGPPGPGDVVRKLFTNLLAWGAERPQ